MMSLGTDVRWELRYHVTVQRVVSRSRGEHVESNSSACISLRGAKWDPPERAKHIHAHPHRSTSHSAAASSARLGRHYSRRKHPMACLPKATIPGQRSVQPAE